MTLEERIWRISKRSPLGFTRYLFGLDRPANGYCVAYSDTQDFFGRDGLRRAIAHARTHAQVIGGWPHQGRYYFDSIRVYHLEKAAIEAAIRENQIGYYDLSGTYKRIMDDNNQLLPKFQKMLNQWNAHRAKVGAQPFRRL
jgi:hypothetical protein